MNESPVWYAAYGSNLALDRLRCYIHGGTLLGSSAYYRGCRVKKDPVDQGRYALSFPLYFARHAAKWQNAGVAFIGSRQSRGSRTLGRVFLLEHDQFEDVVAQENSQRPGQVTVALDVVVTKGYQDVAKRGWYRRVLYIGERSGHPILTCTAARDIDEEEPVAPSPSYLWWICRGLRESWDLSAIEIASYLIPTPGMAAYGTEAELQSVIERLVESELPSVT